MRKLLLITLILVLGLAGRSENNPSDPVIDSLISVIKANWMNQPDVALHVIEQAEQRARKVSPDRFAELVKMRGIVYYYKSEYEVAGRFYQQAFNLYRDRSDSSGMSAILNNLAILSVEITEYEKAMELYIQALEIAEKRKDSSLIGKIYLNMGNIKSELNQPEQSLIHYQKALLYADSIHQKGWYASLLDNIGGSYTDLENFQKSFEYHDKALRTRLEVGDSIPIATSLSNLANVLVNQKKFREALPMYRKALDIYSKLGFKKGLVSTYNFLGNCYQGLGDYAIAREYFSQSIEEAKAMQSGYWEAVGFGNLASVCYVSGNYRDAYEALLKNREIYDSLQVEDSKKHFAELEEKYESQKKEAEIQRLNAEKLQQDKRLISRTAWLLAAIVMALLVIVILVVIRYRQHQKTTQLDRKNLEMENQLLRVQMNPHFLFNSLNSIRYYMDQNPESASQYLTKFARLTRLILEHSRNHWVNLAEEIEAMKLYLAMEQLRLENKFTWQFHIPVELDEDLIEVPPMMFQPFIENAIKHGIMSLPANGLIKVDLAVLEGSKLKVTITDNGVGRSKDSGSTHHQSLGTQLTRERIAGFEKQYRTQLVIRITDLEKAGIPQGTMVELEIPFRNL